MKAVKKKRKTHIKKLWLIFLAAGLFLAGSVYIYAKYYAQSAKNGIAVATGVYFESNYLHEGAADEEFLESTITTQNNNGASFSLEIRNYKNNLLFNKTDILVHYKLKLWLAEPPTNSDITYTVTTDDMAKKTIPYGEANAITIDNQSIAGGGAKKNRYSLEITNTGTGELKPVPIAIVAETIEDEGGHELLQKRLQGKLRLRYLPIASFIEKSQFTFYTDDETQYLEEAKKNSALSYEIMTVSESYSETDVTESLLVAWDPAVLSMYLFDKNYLSYMEKDGVTGLGVFVPQTVEEEKFRNWNYILVDAMSYSAIDIIFLKNELLQENLDNDTITLETLNSYVYVKEAD